MPSYAILIVCVCVCGHMTLKEGSRRKGKPKTKVPKPRHAYVQYVTYIVDKRTHYMERLLAFESLYMKPVGVHMPQRGDSHRGPKG